MAPEYDELLILAQTLGEVKTKTDKLEAEFATQAKPFEAATSALYSAISGIKALQFHVLDNNLGKLSTRVEEMREAINEQVGVIALELKKADAENATKAGQDADSLRAAIADVQANLGTLANQFVAQLQRVEFEAKEEAKKLQLIPGPAGAAGASLNPRGAFIDGETYNRLDVVSWLGSSYIAAVDGVKEKPSKNSNQWQVLASRGSGGAGGVGDFGSLAGVAQINQGGTGQTTRAAGLNALLPSQTGAVQYMLLTDGAGNVSWGAQPVAGLPSQTGNSGELLTTDGVNASWSNAVTVSGSNATVAGTLGVSGTASAGSFHVPGNGATKPADADSYLAATATTKIPLYVSGFTGGGQSADILRVSLNSVSDWFAVKGNGQVACYSTTASTTTSTGALVVGNGTSGGLGVGGAASIGGPILVGTSSDVYLSRVAAGILDIRSASSPGTAARLDVTGTTSAGVGFRQSGTRDWFISAESAELRVTCGTSGSIFAVTNGNPVALRDTTASTTTSTGALVVGNGTSGGLGVGGAIVAGGTITSTASTDSGLLQLNLINSSTGTSASSLFRFNAGTRTASLQAYNDTHATLAGQLRVGTSNGDIVLIPSGVVQATFGPSSTTFASGNVTLTDPSGSILCTGTGNTTATKLLQFTRSDNADVSAFGLTGSAYAGGLAGLGNNETYIYSAAPFRVFIGTAATNRYDFTSSQFKINATTASTSTSSGALVVSGGVGVAGAQYLGVKLNISTHDSSTGGIGFGTETNLYRYQAGGIALDHASGAAPGLLFRENGSSTLRLETNSGVGYLSTLTSANLILRTNATTALTLDTSQNAIFAGTIRTAAPVGGTAASWKLGTVATVTPTSPNRTIEVDIGGTIYYLAAKTTNN